MMDKHQKTKEKRARALKCLDAHLKSPTSGGIQRKTREDNQRDHDRVKAVVDIREEKFEAVRLRLVGQEAAMNRAENTLADVAHRPMNHRCGLRNCFRSRRRTQTNCDG